MKRTIKDNLLLLLSIALFSTLGCTNSGSESGLEPIGILGALDSEIELIKEEMDPRATRTVLGDTYFEGEIEGHRVVLARAGVGKVNAALIAQVMIDRFGVKSMIFTGIAGGINPELHVGDVVISSKVIQHDFGLISSDGFEPWKIAIVDRTGEEKSFAYFEPDTFLVAVARKAAAKVDFPAPDSAISVRVTGAVRVYLGCIVTGDQFIAAEEKRVWLGEVFDAYATEMEGGAVAQVCVKRDLPFVVIRTLSDLANEEASVDIEKFLDYAAKNSAILVIEMLRLM